MQFRGRSHRVTDALTKLGIPNQGEHHDTHHPHAPRDAAAPATHETAERERELRAATGETSARIDNAPTTIGTHIDTLNTDHTREHTTGSHDAAIAILEQLANHLTTPIAGDDQHPFRPRGRIPALKRPASTWR